MTFRLALKAEGDNPLYWMDLQSLIGVADIPIRPEWTYNEESEVVGALGGLSVGRGYASATWHFSVLTNEQRDVLRSFCPGVSAEVYFETPSNEIDLSSNEVFIQALAVMHWPTGEEDHQVNKMMGLDLTFTYIQEI